MLRGQWRSLPSMSRMGLLIAAIGVAFDLVHHVFTHDLHAAEAMQIGFIGHALTLAGMVLALLGVVSAARTSRRRAKQKGEGDAVRCSPAAAR